MSSHLRSRRVVLVAPLVLLALASAVACNDSPTAPDPVATAKRQADRFDAIADSLHNAGSSNEGDFAQAMADLIRVVGRVDNVVVKVDGSSVRHNALLFETLVPESACAGTSDPASCADENPAFAQVVLGWTGTDLKQSFFAGSTQPGVATAFYDGSAIPPGEVYYATRAASAFGIDLFGAPAVAWDSYDGTVTMNAASRGASCSLPSAWEAGVSVTCNLANATPSFDVTSNESSGETTAGSHHITMAAQRVDGVSETVTEAFDPAVFRVARPSTQRLRSARAARALLARVAPVFLHRPAGDARGDRRGR